MHYLKLASLFALPVAFAVTLGAAPQPAEAGKACNRLNLNSPCIRSSDVRPTLKLGRSGNDGDLIVRDSSKVNSVQIDGDSSTVTNTLAGNGLVKAWARVNADGTVDSCWRCDPAQTSRTSTGQYEVDFTPLSTDIRGRPRVCALDKPGAQGEDNFCSMGTNADFSKVDVSNRDSENNAGQTTALQDTPFTIIIF